MVIVGGFGYRWYKTPQEEKGVEIIKPEQTVDETAGWKVYQDEDYGYKIEYPKDWELVEHGGVPLDFGQLDSFWVQSDEYSIGPYTRRDSLIVNVWNPSFYSYDLFLEERPPGGVDPDTIRKKEIILDQEPATEFSYMLVGDAGSGAREGKRVFVQKGQLMVAINCDSEKCGQILSTFKFVK